MFEGNGCKVQMPVEDETAIFTTVKGNFARDFLPSRRSQMVPNAVYRGSPINVGFREALLIAYASDMRRNQKVR